MRKLFIAMMVFTLAISAVPAYSSDQNDVQMEQMSQEEIASLAIISIVGESFAHGMVSGLLTGVCADLQHMSLSRDFWSTVPLYTYLYSKYKKISIDERSLLIGVCFWSGILTGQVAGVTLRVAARIIIEQMIAQVGVALHGSRNTSETKSA